eukprot:CAMPEP_0206135706 /NCGR_PEP_ID=MMETSP1473-20131121/977_1 /ASSEMBLY_ACC=CAM_ASM_001109 /TAXON_ID=1461547 /ORGANISM="Stichococcus sp, Strain RCC1054" /LENGTH=534 /DNA_ID=CAMNT_0053527747 /DNA_START=267 /DNA_END=1871 /DNA_ORIENTATION=-
MNLARNFASIAPRGSENGRSDVIIVGAGHNGLVAAALLAKSGLSVHVLEAKQTVGGACRTEYPFAKAPNLGISTGAYLLGLFPPELLQALELQLPLIRRDPHYFLPTTDHRYLMFGSDVGATERQFKKFFSAQDWEAHVALQAELAALRDDLAPSMMRQPLSLEDTAAVYVRPRLRQEFIELCTKSVKQYLDRFGFKSPLVKAMYAGTDGISGFTGDWNDPGSGANFLLHQMCRLPGADGTWMVVKGGMGTVTQELARVARNAGAKIETGRPVARVNMTDGAASGVTLEDGCTLPASAVVVNADPFRLQQLVGPPHLPPHVTAHQAMDGCVLKVNLALDGLPRFSCLPEPVGQHRTTTHLLPDEDVINDSMKQMFEQTSHGQLPDFPVIELYQHTGVDPTLQDDKGRHNSALFVCPVPWSPVNSSWDVELNGYVEHLLSIVDRFAPGFSSQVVDAFALSPPKIEEYFGITRGHIHHIQSGTFHFDKRFPTSVLQGLYSASAGCHPGGGVTGCAGHNAAVQLLHDIGKQPAWQRP